MASADRAPYWDNWKGIAIIAVVAIHASNTTGAFPKGSFNWIFGLEFRQLVNFAVPMFFAISGYFAARSPRNSTADYYSGRIWRILAPYILWTTIFLAIRSPGAFPSFGEIIRGFLLGTGIGVGYFVIALLQFIAITPPLARIKKMHIHILLICAGTIFGLAFTYYFRTHPSSVFSRFPANAILFFVWYPFYHVGLLVGMRNDQLGTKFRRKTVLWVVFSASLLAAFSEAAFWGFHGLYGAGASQLKASNFSASLALFAIAIQLSKEHGWLHKNSHLTLLGRNSFAVYLVHLLPLAAADKLFSRIDALFDVQPFYILTTTSFTIVSCAIFIVILRAFIPARAARLMLG